jgi:GxxExxY protein
MVLSALTPIPPETERVAHRVIGCGITVHRILGPGFKEVIYQRAFALELDSSGLHYESERKILVRYKDWDIPGHRIDLIVEGCVLVELKAIPRLRPIHTRQVVSYLKATHLRLGLLLNFNVNVLKDGTKRIVL